MVLALPLVLSSLSWTLLTFIDRIFLMWWSTDALAASFPAALLWWTSICFPLGISMYVGTFVSQYYGASDHRGIGPIVWQGVWIAVIATPIVSLIVPLAPWIFEAANHHPSVRPLEITYYRYLCLGTGGMLISYALSSFYSGQGKTWVVMLIDAGATILNIVLDYLWIFGYAGFPAMGVQGAAMATSLAFWIKVVIYLILILRSSNSKKFSTRQFGFQRRLTGRLLYYGGPSGAQMFLEVFGFSAFVFLVGRLGVLELAATNMAFNVSSVAFMPVFGLSTAASIMVGQQLGRNQTELAARATWTTMWIAIAYMGFISALYVITPNLFLFAFFMEEQEGGQQIRTMAVVLLRYVAAYNIFDALNLVFANAVKGAGDTHFVLFVSLAMAIVLAVSTWIGLQRFNFGLHGSWSLVTVWISLLGTIYIARFCQGKWRSMRVIDVDTSPAAA